MAAPVDRGDLLGTEPVWLLTMSFAGRRFRLATQPVSVPSATGDLPYDGTLDSIDYSETIERLATTPSDQSAGIACDLGVDVATLRRAGHAIEGRIAELALIWVRDGIAITSWEDRMVVLSGALRGVRYGDPMRAQGWIEGEVETSVDLAAGGRLVDVAAFTDDLIFRPDRTYTTAPERKLRDVDGAIGPAGTEPIKIVTLDTSTWPDAADLEGKVYPIVIGAPGGRYRKANVTPAYPIEITGANADTLLIAGHRVLATEVFITSASYAGYRTVTHTKDGHGRTVAIVNVSGLAAAATDEYFVGWHMNGGDPSFGMASPWDPDLPLNGVVDTILWTMYRSGIQIDWGAWHPFRVAFADVLVDTYVNDTTLGAWDWVSDQLLPLLPLGVAWGPDGVYPMSWLPGLVAAEAIDTLTEGPACRRVSGVIPETTADEIENTISLAYNYDRNDVSVDSVVVSDEPASDATGIESVLSIADDQTIASIATYGVRSAEISAEVVCDRATATKIATWYAHAHGEIVESFDVEASPDVGAVLRLGARYRWVEEAAGMAAGQLVQLLSRRWEDGRWTLTFAIDVDVARDGVIT